MKYLLRWSQFKRGPAEYDIERTHYWWNVARCNICWTFTSTMGLVLLLKPTNCWVTGELYLASYGHIHKRSEKWWLCDSVASWSIVLDVLPWTMMRHHHFMSILFMRGLFHVISTFCNTSVSQNVEVTRKSPSSVHSMSSSIMCVETCYIIPSQGSVKTAC